MGDRLDTTDMSQKLGAMPPFGGAGSPSNTMWPGLRPTCMPNFILIHPAVWPQYTNITDRQDRTDRQENDPIAYSEPFDKWSPKKETWPPWFLQQLPLFQGPQILYFLPRYSGRPVQRCPDNYSICTPMPGCSLVKCNHATASIRCCSSRELSLELSWFVMYSNRIWRSRDSHRHLNVSNTLIHCQLIALLHL